MIHSKVLHDGQREKSASTQSAGEVGTFGWSSRSKIRLRPSDWKMSTLLSSFTTSWRTLLSIMRALSCSEPLKANRQLLQIPHFQSHDLRISIRQNGQNFSPQRCAQCYQQRREVWKASSLDPPFIESHREVPQRHAEARYVTKSFFHLFGMITR